MDNTVVVIDLANGEILNRLSDHTDVVNSIDISHDGTKLVTAGLDHKA